MRERRKVKRGLIFLLLFLTAGLVFQPLQASETQCGIWCPICAKWQERYIGEKSESSGETNKKVITVSCKDCGNGLIKLTQGDERRIDSDSEEQITLWSEDYSVEKCASEVEFPQMLAHLEGHDGSKNRYRVVSDGNIYETTGYGWTTKDVYDVAVAALQPLVDSLYNCADEEFTWEDWYNSGLTTNSLGVKNSPLLYYLNEFGIKPVLQEKQTSSVLSVIGDASVQIYRDGVCVEGDAQVGDIVQLSPMKISGREYADYTISNNAENVSWNEEEQLLSFTMPEGEVSVALGYWELKGLSIELSPLFFETYQKEPYWDGMSFNLDCEPPITIGKEMLSVRATVQNSRTLEIQEREVPEFTITGDNQIVNVGENSVVVSADVFGDGYILEGKCIIRAESVALKEIMEETESETYTELKTYVESLMRNVEGYEQMIVELSENLEVSEEQRMENEKRLAEAVEEVDNLTLKLEENKEKLGLASDELAMMSEELTEMKGTLVTMQEFLQQITGETEIEGELLEKAQEEFEKFKEQKENLTLKLEMLETEKGKLLKENENLTEKNTVLKENNETLEGKNLALKEKNQNLTERLENVSEENKILQNRLESVMTNNTELAEQIKYTLEEQQLILREYELLKNNYAVLQEEKKGFGEQIAVLMQENTMLVEQAEALEIERKGWQDKYELLLAKQKESTALKDERIVVELTEVTTQMATEGKTERIEKDTPKAEVQTMPERATKAEHELVATETASETVLATAETMTSIYPLETENIKKEEADYQSAGIGSGRKLLPGIAVVIAAMLLGGVVLYFSLEQKELPFTIENLKNLG